VLECGGKNPALVFNDADDIAAVAGHVLNGAFWNMGENCSATSRLLVQEDVKEALLAEMAKQIGNWTM
ncbi:aldehyde dehydrogenase family protein, partial [Klebsiella pneumoniae]|uniref:aldehyde dehydrogenase family protein n=2 Tax=Enterobacterales TaxID=91347 RepID=UPI0013D09BAD